jgi:hypothetical protein
MSWLDGAETVACLLTGTILANRSLDAYVFQLPSPSTVAMKVEAAREPDGWLTALGCLRPASTIRFTPRMDRASTSQADVLPIVELPPVRMVADAASGGDELNPGDIGRAISCVAHAVGLLGRPPLAVFGGAPARPLGSDTAAPGKPQETAPVERRLCGTLPASLPPDSVLRIAAGYGAGSCATHSMTFQVTRTGAAAATATTVTTVLPGHFELSISMSCNRVTARFAAVPGPPGGSPSPPATTATGFFHQAMRFRDGAWSCGDCVDTSCTVDNVVAVACSVAADARKQWDAAT